MEKTNRKVVNIEGIAGPYVTKPYPVSHPKPTGGIIYK
jgi:hypothetical protein